MALPGSRGMPFVNEQAFGNQLVFRSDGFARTMKLRSERPAVGQQVVDAERSVRRLRSVLTSQEPH